MNTNYNAETVKLSMDTINNTLNSKLNDYQLAVETEFGSLYTKDDVSKLLQRFSNDVLSVLDNQVEETTKTEPVSNEKQIDYEMLEDKINSCIYNAIKNMNENNVVEIDTHSADFYIRNGNEIELDNVPFSIDNDYIHECITEEISELIEDLKNESNEQ